MHIISVLALIMHLCGKAADSCSNSTAQSENVQGHQAVPQPCVLSDAQLHCPQDGSHMTCR